MKKAVAEVDWRTHAEDKPASGSKPAGLTEFTPRAILCGLVVALVMGASYPYIVLKLGFGPNASVVSAFLGYLLLGIAFKDYNRWENNIVQTARHGGGADGIHVRAARSVRYARRQQNGLVHPRC